MFATFFVAIIIFGVLASILYIGEHRNPPPAAVFAYYQEDIEDTHVEDEDTPVLNIPDDLPPPTILLPSPTPPIDEVEETDEIYIPYEPAEYIPEEPQTCPYTVTILLSAGGDATLGGDRRWGGYHAFMREFDDSGGNHSIFLENVAHIFYESDLSIVNLEGVLSDILYPHMEKEFIFRGPPHFANILAAGNIDAVTIANNHTQDFFRRGYDDTRAALTYAGIEYFGNEFNRIIEVNGIKVGLFGRRIWNDSRYNQNMIRNSIQYLRNNGAQLIIAYYHWGVERENIPEQYQINIGRFTIAQGADLVLGAHPHVIQSIEEYRGRYIVYSLANFSFGGNANPRDQDSIIFQQTFTFYRGALQPNNDINIIPIFSSSVRNRNDFRPTPAHGEEAERILSRIERYSAALR